MHPNATTRPAKPKGQPEDLKPPIKDAYLYPHNRHQSAAASPKGLGKGLEAVGKWQGPAANNAPNVDASGGSIVRPGSDTKRDFATEAVEAVRSLPNEVKRDVATETVIALPSEAKKDVASAAMQTLSQEAKKDVASAAMQTLPQEARNDVVTEMVRSLSPEARETILKSLAPSQGAVDRIWLIIVGAFATVFVLAAVALFASAFWSPGQIQVLLTVVTTVAGVLAGFVSGRASSSGTST